MIFSDVRTADRQELHRLGFAEIGQGVRIACRRLTVGSDVRLADGAILAGDEIVLGDAVEIGAGADIRSSRIEIGARSRIDRDAGILATDCFVVGRAGWFRTKADIACRSFEAGNLLYLENGFTVGGGGSLSSTGIVEIGDHVALGSFSMINANCRVRIDDGVGSGDFLSIWTSGYHFGHRLVEGFGPTFEPVHIHRNVWLAHHVTVLPGCAIGADTIVAAGSVVTKSLPERVLAAGIPAQVRRQLAFVTAERADLERSLAEILLRWAEELRWKGWRVDEAPDGGSGLVLLAHCPETGRRGWVRLGDAAGEWQPGPADFQVTVSCDPAEVASPVPPGNAAILNVLSGTYRGASFDVAEDMRDFLRRNTLPCGDENRFSSIVPANVRRLRQLI